MPHEKLITDVQMKVQKRNGQIVAYNESRVKKAIGNAFKGQAGLPREVELPVELARNADRVTQQVSSVLSDFDKEYLAVEEIQDLVEKNLMDAGYQDVANRYIAYRQERARLRLAPQEKKAETAVDVYLDEVRFYIETCCAGLENVSVNTILSESKKNYFEGITKEQLMTANIMAARSFIEKDPQYSFVAARLLLLSLYKETLGRLVVFDEMKVEYPNYFSKYVQKAVELDLLSPDLLQFDLKLLGHYLKPKRDFLFHYMGLQTLYDRYFLHLEEQRLELPQIFWMRVAMGLAKKEGADKNKRAIEFYDVLSTFLFTPSTPTLFNSGTRHSQLSSCFVTAIDDDLFHIFKSIQDDAMLSKWSGGLGNDWTNVRALGSRIKGTNGKSQGVVPFMKVANDTAVAVNQGGKRQGAMCAYLEVWHHDFEDFLELRKNTGDERRRTHDMHTAAWIPDLFMKRIKENGEWTLFSPSEVPNLHHIYGQEFERCYAECEQKAKDGKIRQFKVIPAIQLWRKMLNMLFETGHPWITWKDPSNIRSPQDHVGVIHSSNLCTEILLNTSPEETAVCNLGSLNLSAHTTEQGLDQSKIKTTLLSAIRMLDNVIDLNFYPTKEAEAANQKHRPTGLGIMGFQDALFIQNISYVSNEAVKFADESMEAISYYAIEASINLAKERGAYSTYRGSKWDRGLLPIDTIGLLEKERGGYLNMDKSSTLDWTAVRRELGKCGIRNSAVMAIAPTATIGNIVGVTASIEPIYKNIFVKSNLSGEFTVVNEFLVEDLKKLGLWDQEMINDLKYFDGSVQEIIRIPVELKRKYATAFEIEYEWLIEAASRRQKWIDMGQSLNLYQAKPSGKKVSDMYMLAWEKGLKTTYYLRSMGATRIEKSTLDITKYDNVVGRRERNELGRVVDAEQPASKVFSDGCEACQ